MGDMIIITVNYQDIVKMTILSKFIYRLNKITIKIPAHCFVDTDELFIKCIRKCKGPSIAKTTLKRK